MLLRADSYDPSTGTWSDVSGNSRNATQSTSSLKPTKVSNAINGKDGVYFNGTKRLSVSNFTANPTAMALFAVFRPINYHPEGTAYLLKQKSNGNAFSVPCVEFNHSSNSAGMVVTTNNNRPNSSSTALGGFVYDTNLWTCQGFHIDGSGDMRRIFYNLDGTYYLGNPQVVNVLGDNINCATQTIGAGTDNSIYFGHFNGYICEMRLYEGLTISQIQSMVAQNREYISSYYGIN